MEGEEELEDKEKEELEEEEEEEKKEADVGEVWVLTGRSVKAIPAGERRGKRESASA